MAAKRGSEATGKRGMRQAAAKKRGGAATGGRGRGDAASKEFAQCVSRLKGNIAVVDMNKDSEAKQVDAVADLLGLRRKKRKVRFVILNAPFKVRGQQSAS